MEAVMKFLVNPAIALGTALICALGAPAVQGQEPSARIESYPSRPIRWIVPYPPGGPTDTVARIVADRLSERMRQPVVIDNRAGAFGNIGLEAAARAAPDGYTIVFGMTSMAVNPALHRLSDPLAQLTAVSQLATVHYVLLANADLPHRTLPEVLAAARAHPGTVTCGFGATLFQLGCELLKVQGAVDIIAVPYKGSAPAMNDLIGGRIQLLFDAVNTALPQIRAGRVRAIASAAPRRGAGPLEGLPTVSETLPGFELTGWFGVLAPAATSRPIIDRLNLEIAAVLEEGSVRARFADSGLEVTHGTPDAFDQLIRRDMTRYSKIVHDLDIKAD
jgi:tripartite-type tricarboxylate transporter receptor subunit TctC